MGGFVYMDGPAGWVSVVKQIPYRAYSTWLAWFTWGMPRADTGGSGGDPTSAL